MDVQRPMKPVVKYRYSRSSESYDPMFYSNGRALGSWFPARLQATMQALLKLIPKSTMLASMRFSPDREYRRAAL